MYIFTNKALREHDKKLYEKANIEVTKLWQKEFEAQKSSEKSLKYNNLLNLNSIETSLVRFYNDINNKSIKKVELIKMVEEYVTKTLDEIKLYKEE